MTVVPYASYLCPQSVGTGTPTADSGNGIDATRRLGDIPSPSDGPGGLFSGLGGAGVRH